jgi:hypothetical protein
LTVICELAQDAITLQGLALFDFKKAFRFIQQSLIN